ncbi:hypothetical protein GTP90_31130, partial [Rugamonas sp. FT81W]|nr:hypothetical protein [Duganella vulcania]
MKRRSLLQAMAALPLMSLTTLPAWSAARTASRRRVRPGEAGWPSASAWRQLG